MKPWPLLSLLMLLGCAGLHGAGPRVAALARSQHADDSIARVAVPQLDFEYAYGFDFFCPEHVQPEPLNDWQLKLIPRIPVYREELVKRVGEFAHHWDTVASDYLRKAVEIVGTPWAGEHHHRASGRRRWRGH